MRNNLRKYKSIFDLIEYFYDEEKCIKYLESIYWPDNKIISPFDYKSEIYKLDSRPYNYMCKNTQKIFNVKHNTVFFHSRLPLRKWFVAIYLYFLDKDKNNDEKNSILKISKFLALSYKTTWLMIQKIKQNEKECRIIYEGGEKSPISICNKIYNFIFKNFIKQNFKIFSEQKQSDIFNKVDRLVEVKNKINKVVEEKDVKSVKKEKLINYYIYNFIDSDDYKIVYVILSTSDDISKIKIGLRGIVYQNNYNNPLLKEFIIKNNSNLQIKMVKSFKCKEYKNAYLRRKRFIAGLKKLGYTVLNKD